MTRRIRSKKSQSREQTPEAGRKVRFRGFLFGVLSKSNRVVANSKRRKAREAVIGSPPHRSQSGQELVGKRPALDAGCAGSTPAVPTIFRVCSEVGLEAAI